MKTNKTIDLTEQYSAPKCKVVDIKAQRVLCMSGNETQEYDEQDADGMFI